MSEPETEPVAPPASDDDGDLAEQVEHEQAEHDAANTEPELGPAPEHEPEASAAVGLSPEEMERRFKAATKLHATYAKGIARTFEGQTDDLTDCPLCAGLIPGYVLIADAGRVEPATKAAVQAFLGVVPEADYLPHPTAHRCEVCNGLGKVLSGSRVPNNETLICPACNGSGHDGALAGLLNGGVPNEQVAVAVGAVPSLEPPADVDLWGSPRLLPDGRENPNYGKLGNYKDPNYP
jgi:hypothetical protein